MTPNPRFLLIRSSYPIVGSTAAELRTVMRTLGPTRSGRTFAAYIDWEVTWTFGTERTPDGVRMTDLAVTVRAQVVVPRWRAPRSAPTSLLEGGRYLAAE